jgi:hypothetical protein
VTWSSNLSTRCFEHAEYLLENKDASAAPKPSTTELLDLGGTHLGSDVRPAGHRRDARFNLGRAEEMFEQWLMIPGYRDALVSHFLRTIGHVLRQGRARAERRRRHRRAAFEARWLPPVAVARRDRRSRARSRSS